MPRTVLVDSVSRSILILDPDPETPAPEGVITEPIVLADAEAAKLSQLGSYKASAAGIVTVTAPGPETPGVIEHDAALADLEAQYAAAMTRLTQIVGASTPTNAQVVAAVQDIAKYVRVLARLNHAEFIGSG